MVVGKPGEAKVIKRLLNAFFFHKEQGGLLFRIRFTVSRDECQACPPHVDGAIKKCTRSDKGPGAALVGQERRREEEWKLETF